VSASAAIYLGVDIGKDAHYAVAVDTAGTAIYRTAVANDEAALHTLVSWAQEQAATVVVDQPGGAAALLLQLCWGADVPIGYLHGLAMARARDFYAGEGKTDPKDAFVLADVARAHPRRIVWLEETAEARAQLELLCGYDADLRADANRLGNRLRALLATHWPTLERTLDDRLDSLGMLAVLQKYPSAAALRRAGVRRVRHVLAAQRVRQADTWAARVVQAAGTQTVEVPGSAVAARVIAELAEQLARVLTRRRVLEQEIDQAFFALPEAAILHSLPGIGPRLGARIAVEIGDIARFPTAAHLAAYAGLGPTPRQSGTSLRGNIASRHGNHRLKNALFLAAFASLRHPPSRTYYDRKRAEGKGHNQAVLCLARRRVDVLHAMLKHARPYSFQDRTPAVPIPA
jgi:transposase